MRIAGPDIVLFAVGLLLFGGAGYALVQQGGVGVLTQPGSATGVYTVEFPLTKMELGKEAVANYGSATVEFNVNQTNVAKVTFVFACTDPLPGGTFALQITIEPPAGLKADPKAGACGSTLEVPIEVASPPPATTAQGATADEATANLPPSENATKATGVWKVTVRGARGGQLPGLPGPSPNGNIILNADVWAPKLTPVQK